jgi:O-antigen/teichoic acid export membrane protein
LESKIPLRRTGLIIFSSRMLSVFSGMLFLIMITGWLTPPRFGLWEVILSLVAFASFPAGWLGFWATREVARGKMVGRTAVFLNLALSSAGAAAYLIFAALGYPLFGVTFGPFFFAVLLVPLGYWSQAANSVAAGYRPSALGYSLLFSEAAKLAVAYPALFVFKLELNGVILALIVSNFVQAAVTTVLVRNAVSEDVRLDLGRKWLRDSWVPALYSLGALIATGDTIVASLVTGATVLTGYYQAAFQIGTLVSYATFLSYALYPLLLRGSSDEAPNATLDLILIFATPMTVGVIALAPRLLTVLRPEYVAPGKDVTLALCILAVAGLLTAVSAFLDSTLIGKERSDLAHGRGAGAYLGTAFSFVSFVNISYASAYTIAVVLTTSLGTAYNLSISAIVSVWALSQLALLVIATAVKLRRLRRSVMLTIPTGLGKYLALSLLMGIILYGLSAPLVQGVTDRLDYGLRVAGVALLGAAFYFGTLIAVDRKTRDLAARVIGWFR